MQCFSPGVTGGFPQRAALTVWAGAVQSPPDWSFTGSSALHGVCLCYGQGLRARKQLSFLIPWLQALLFYFRLFSFCPIPCHEESFAITERWQRCQWRGFSSSYFEAFIPALGQQEHIPILSIFSKALTFRRSRCADPTEHPRWPPWLGGSRRARTTTALLRPPLKGACSSFLIIIMGHSLQNPRRH